MDSASSETAKGATSDSVSHKVLASRGGENRAAGKTCKIEGLRYTLDWTVRHTFAGLQPAGRQGGGVKVDRSRVGNHHFFEDN